MYLSPISIPGDLCQYFLLWSEENGALENYCIDICRTMFSFKFLEGQVHQIECKVAFSSHEIALYLMYLSFEICKQKLCMKKASSN